MAATQGHEVRGLRRIIYPVACMWALPEMASTMISSPAAAQRRGDGAIQPRGVCSARNSCRSGGCSCKRQPPQQP